MESILHKIQFSKEAIFDYEHCLVNRIYPKLVDDNWNIESKYEKPIINFKNVRKVIADELEEYIQRHSKRDLVNNFRLPYFDESLNKELLLFIKRDEKLDSFQHWVICGICLSEDFDPAYEYGYWLNTKLDCNSREDWVVNLRRSVEQEQQDYEFMERKYA